MGDEGTGVLLYLNQEVGGSASQTRCVPTLFRTKALIRSRQTIDWALDDERDLALGADILRKLGFTRRGS